MSNADIVAGIYFVSGIMFLGGLFTSALSTIVRALVYRREKVKRPWLLTRDMIVFGGTAISFGVITLARFLPPDARSALTMGNVVWALVTTVPAVIGVVTYAVFEIAIVERARKPE